MADFEPGGAATGAAVRSVTTARPAEPTESKALLTLRARLKEIADGKAAITNRVSERQAKEPDNPAAGISPSEQTALNNLEKETGEVIQQIATEQAKTDTKPTVVSPSASDRYIIQIDPKTNQVIKDPVTGKPPENPNWDKTSTKPQVTTVGNNTLVIDNDGNVKVAYTDKDAAELEARNTAVAEANQRTAAAAQNATRIAEEARVRIEEARAKGEHAETIQAQTVIDLRKAHDEWTRADGDKTTAQASLRDYNTNRHAIALESISREELEQKRTTEKNLNARELRSQDLTKQAADATVKASLANQRLSSGQAYMGNVLSTMSELNKTVQPGSDAVAQMLPGLLNVGEAFFSKLGGLPGDVTSNAPAPAAAAAAAPPPLPGLADAGKTLEETQVKNQGDIISARTNPEFAADPTAHRQLGIPMPTETQTEDFEERVRKQRQALIDAYNLNPGGAAFQQTAGPGFGVGFGTGMPSFQTGGVVPGAPGQPVPIMAHAGETVLPTGQPGMPPPPMPAGPMPPPPMPPPPAAPMGPPPAGPESTIAQFLGIMAQLLGGAGEMAPIAAQAAAATGNPPPAAANPTLPGSAVPGVPPQAAAAQARMQPLAPDGSPYAKPDDVARIFGRKPQTPQGPQMASQVGGGMPQPQMPMPQGAAR